MIFFLKGIKQRAIFWKTKGEWQLKILMFDILMVNYYPEPTVTL